jgi:tripartite-type tricarboxylate transporter receptor subunit TctC
MPASKFLAVVGLALAAQVGWAAGEDFPAKQISLVVPFAAGGSLDATARVVGEKMKDYLGQPVVVVNRPGAGSSLGARSVATAKPDGYTLFIASGSAYGFIHLLQPGYNYQLKDFAPIAGIATNSSLFAVQADVPVKTLPELVDYARKNPGKLNFCTTGMGGLNHLQLEQLKSVVREKNAGSPVNLTHVPYNGLAPALTALRAGDVQACALPYSALVKSHDGKGIRMLAVMRGQRLAGSPELPTVVEQGFAELDGNDALVNVSAPAGTPQAVLSKLEDALRKTMQDPEIRKKLEELDVQPTWVDLAGTREWLEQDVRKFEKIIKTAGLEVAQ